MAKDAPRKHHYVPQFLLRNFTDVSGALWIYDTELGTIRSGNTKSAAFQNDLYALKGVDGKFDYASIERALANEIDGPGAIAISCLLRPAWPPVDTWGQFIGFIAAQMHRTPVFFERVLKLLAPSMQEQLQRMGKFSPKFREHVREALANCGATPTEIEQELKRIGNGDYEITPDPKRALGLAMKLILPTHRELSKMRWAIMQVPEGDPDLLIGDHPVLMSDQGPNEQPRRPLGLRNPNIEIVFPIGSRVAVVGGWNEKWGMGELMPGSVNVINKRTMSHARRFIFASVNSKKLLGNAKRLRGKGPKVRTTKIRFGNHTAVFSEYS